MTHKKTNSLFARCATAITVIELPLCIAGALFGQGETRALGTMLDLIANGIFGLYLLVLTVLGLWYAVGLTAILDGMKSEKGKAVRPLCCKNANVKSSHLKHSYFVAYTSNRGLKDGG